jgi:hypothetical protein
MPAEQNNLITRRRSLGLLATGGAGLWVAGWHCNASGVYPDISSERTIGQTYLRGVQLTDKHGRASFKSIFPGHYSGRTTHIHARIHINSHDTDHKLAGGTSVTPARCSRPKPCTARCTSGALQFRDRHDRHPRERPRLDPTAWTRGPDEIHEARPQAEQRSDRLAHDGGQPQRHLRSDRRHERQHERPGRYPTARDTAHVSAELTQPELTRTDPTGPPSHARRSQPAIESSHQRADS